MTFCHSHSPFPLRSLPLRSTSGLCFPPHLCITPGQPMPAADQGSQHALWLALLQRGAVGGEQHAPHVQLHKVRQAGGDRGAGGLEGAGGGLLLGRGPRCCCSCCCGQAGGFAGGLLPLPPLPAFCPCAAARPLPPHAWRPLCLHTDCAGTASSSAAGIRLGVSPYSCMPTIDD